eukprot:CAMPEP_0116152642 /NCGR_PEP_ID=MMETSP0329-20121206/20791_1 /TAXON_ID=697910 /ORGANISM="Pseudo-nitzschia arenysensis, Strain B593" /LENGTH=524 /DNA_ID=CAMNT_0003649439 /DNA_START=35 /DNA_END=1609 /DNA_ORIENTATION=-
MDYRCDDGTIGDTEGVPSEKLAFSNVCASSGDEEQIQKSAVSTPADPTIVCLSNLQLEKIEVDKCIQKKKSKLEEQSRISRIPVSVTLQGALSIVWLDLSRNNLTSLPKELFGVNIDGSISCPMLEYLNVGRNRLKELPSEIGNCKKLKTLILLSNNFRPSGFPIDAIVSLPLLETLDLRWNQKMNNQSSRKRLTEIFPQSGCETQQKTVKLLLSHTPIQDNNNSNTNTKKLSACDRDANELRSQLEPLSTPQLRKRLHRSYGVTFKDSDESAYDRETVMRKLLQCYGSNDSLDNSGNPVPQRTIRQEHGVPLDQTLLQELLVEMEAIQWPRTTRERPKIAAQGYVILQRPPPSTIEAEASTKVQTKKEKREADKLQRFTGIWNKAVEAIESVDKEFARSFTALAVTKNFTGSPHIDTLNIAPFYGIALGEFSNGGKLCVECSATCVAEIDTKGRFAKVDGRFCHWVSDYEGTRYSLIYYVTHGTAIPQTTAIFKPPFVETVRTNKKDNNDGTSEWIPPPVFVP